MNNYDTALGIDVSKKTFDIALFRNKKMKNKSFKNSAEGFAQLQQWLEKQSVDNLHVCMESTGIYDEALAEFIFDIGCDVSVVNSARVKGYARDCKLDCVSAYH